MDLACSIGVNNEEIDWILEIEGIKDAEGIISFTGQIVLDTRSSGATLISATERIVFPILSRAECRKREMNVP